jgi:nifR3 family TIM-barrel protein
MRIRDIDIDPALILAPMEGVTNLTFRRLIRSIGGCGLTVTEFIPGRSLAGGHANALKMARFDPDERPISIQVYGRDPEVMADAARFVVDLGADIVDLNMGCPSKKVCQNSGGSALMKEPEVARDIVRAMRAAVSVPFTVKMRSGWDPDHKNAPELAYMCQEEGAEMVAVHWRTRADLYGGVRELDTLAEVKRRLSIPVVANGDIVDPASARETLAYTGVDGLMIGRGAIRDPWVFQRILRDRRGEPPLVVDAAEKERVLLGYFEVLQRNSKNDRQALGRMKKIARYFTANLPDAERLRTTVLHAQSIEEATTGVTSFFDDLRDRPLAAAS